MIATNRRLAAATLIALLTALSAAQPAGPPARWHLDGATNRCVLTRSLEGNPGRATFILRTVPGSGRYDLILAGPELPDGLRGEAKLALVPARVSYQGEGRRVELPGQMGSGVGFGPFPQSFRREFGTTSTLRLAREDGTEVGSWAVPGAPKAAEAMTFCESEKQIEWGADPASVEPGATPPRPVGDPFKWLGARDLGINTADAPSSVAFAAVFRLLVGPDGRATDCVLLESAGNVDLRGDICKSLLRRARYEAALDAGGKPVTSIAIHIVSVRMDVEFRSVPG